MNRLFNIVLLSMVAVFGLQSCMNDDEEEGSSVCMIAGFTLNDIVSPYTTKTLAGKDTTYNRTISGSSILFNIDQLNGHIYAVDSLPSWMKVTKIVPVVTYAGSLYCRQGEESSDFYYFRSGRDSIDFTKPVTFKVVSSDGKYSRDYDFKVLKRNYEPDSLYWTEVKSNLTLKGAHRSLSRGSYIYVFAENGGTPSVTICDASGNSLEWSKPELLSEKLNYKSLTLFGSDFYGLDYEGYVYSSADAIHWEKRSDRILTRLLCSDSRLLYGYDGSHLLSTSDGVEWSEEVVNNLDMLPEMPVSYACYQTRTNSSLSNVVMLGNNSSSEYAVAWFKISSDNSSSNQPWNYINISAENEYAMPLLENLQMVYYKGMLIAIGGKSYSGGLQSYAWVYLSEDNGITWHAQESNMSTLSSWKGSSAMLSMVSCGENIWVIQSGGKIWKGFVSTD